MKNTKTKIMALAASAALVAMLGLAACGGGSSSAASSAASSSAASSSTAASASSEAASSASTAASSASTAASSAATSSAATSAAATSATAPEASSAAVAAIEEQYSDVELFGYEGVSNANELYFLAMDEQGTYGILVILDETGKYLSFVGPMANEGTMFQIVDESTGDSFGFEMTAAENGAYLFDAGDAGQIVLVQTDVDEVFKALAEIDSKGTAVN